jgi:acyl-CoA reductase-like NAD-dependent aldehyde dehydrogenase
VLENVRPDMRVYSEEVFGPVVSVVPFDSDEEAIALNNATEYGLSVGVITQSMERAMNFTSKLKTGIIHINDQTVADEPWPSAGRLPRRRAPWRNASWEKFTQWRSRWDKAPPYPF